jgi:hypothetical protein
MQIVFDPVVVRNFVNFVIVLLKFFDQEKITSEPKIWDFLCFFGCHWPDKFFMFLVLNVMFFFTDYWIGL